MPTSDSLARTTSALPSRYTGEPSRPRPVSSTFCSSPRAGSAGALPASDGTPRPAPPTAYRRVSHPLPTCLSLPTRLWPLAPCQLRPMRHSHRQVQPLWPAGAVLPAPAPVASHPGAPRLASAAALGRVPRPTPPARRCMEAAGSGTGAMERGAPSGSPSTGRAWPHMAARQPDTCTHSPRAHLQCQRSWASPSLFARLPPSSSSVTSMRLRWRPAPCAAGGGSEAYTPSSCTR